MFNSILLDVFIGLAFIYILLSLVVAASIEALSGITKMRNNLLESAMQEIVGDEKFINLFYHHPVIKSFKRKPLFLSLMYHIYSWPVAKFFKISWLIKKCNMVKLYHIVSMGRPSYLSSNIFSLVLLDFIRGGFDGIVRRYAPLIDTKKLVADSGDAGEIESNELTEKENDWVVFRFNAHEVYTRKEIEAWLLKFNYFREMSSIVERTTAEDTSLSTILMEREPILERIAAWFDLQMERVTGVYKRKTQAFLFLISLIICCALNADTIMMANILWSDPVMRNAVVFEAEEAVRNASQTADEQGPDADALNKAIAGDDACTECGKLTVAEVAAKNSRMRPFPIGWERQKSAVFKDYRAMPQNFKEFIYKVLGILITTFLISLGSPFWFDLLSKIVNIRNVGLKPAATGAPAAAKEQKGA